MKIMELQSDPSGARRSLREKYRRNRTFVFLINLNVRQLTEGIKRFRIGMDV